MKKIAGLALLGIVLLNSLPSNAQTYAESALLFSRTRPGGSARIQALGGTQVSLGGDYSSAVSNPAGLGMFNRSEFSITPGLNMFSSNSDFLGNSTPASKTTFQIPGFSLAIHPDKTNENGFLGGTFVFSFNRLNDFNKSFSYSGTNSSNSIIDYFIQDATGFDPSTLLPGGSYADTPTALGYNNFLIEDSTFINPNASNTDYMSVVGTYGPSDIRTVFQQEDVKTSGAQNQTSIAYGVNFFDKIFLGAGLGLASIKYQSTKTYTESNFHFLADPGYRPLNEMVLTENLRTNGTGINASFGIIYRPVDIVQFGLSYNTPTLYTLTDSYSANMTSDWNNFDYNGDGSVMLNKEGADTKTVLTENYTLTTPSRLNVGATVFVAKSGFLSGDAEFVNYDGANYSPGSSGSTFDSENKEVKGLYQSTINFRVGGEYRYKVFRARAGYSYMPDPYKSTQNGITGEVTSISAGLGYRIKTFYVDVAAIFTNGNSSYRPYSINSVNSPLVTTANKTTMVMMTVGFPF